MVFFLLFFLSWRLMLLLLLLIILREVIIVIMYNCFFFFLYMFICMVTNYLIIIASSSSITGNYICWYHNHLCNYYYTCNIIFTVFIINQNLHLHLHQCCCHHLVIIITMVSQYEYYCIQVATTITTITPFLHSQYTMQVYLNRCSVSQYVERASRNG